MRVVRIGIDARAAFIDPHRGFGRVTRCLVNVMLPLAPGEIVVFVPRGSHIPEPWYRLAASVVQLRRPRRGAFLFDGPAWRQTLRRHPVDVLYLPAWGVPPGIPVPVVGTFHDATPFRFPSPASRWKRWRVRAGLRSLRRATLVHAVSQHAASEAVEYAGIDPDRIKVVHWGVGPPFQPAAEAVEPEHVLYVGGLDPHKNLAVVLAAYGLPGAEALPPLVVAGPVSTAALSAAGRDLIARGRLRIEKRPDDERLVELYQRALALVMPSLNEGFGLPALEAMACGCPVVAATGTDPAELVRGAGKLCAPGAPDSWAEALLRLRAQRSERDQIVRRGVARAARHSWTNSAVGLIAVLTAAASMSAEELPT